MNNKILFSACLIFSSTITQASDEQKYSRGDCITPTNETYSWFSKFARVDAFSEINGFSGKKYILTFPNSVSNDSIFSKDIERDTKLMDKQNCRIE